MPPRKIPKAKSAKSKKKVSPSPSQEAELEELSTDDLLWNETTIADSTPNNRDIVFTNISALKLIMSRYVKTDNTISEYEDETSLPQTIVPDGFDDDDSSSFLDARKTKIKVWPDMHDVLTAGALPSTTSLRCWWDHHPIEGRPVGCPLYLVTSAPQRDHDGVERGSSVEIASTFETEGMFCGLCCCKAYIISKGCNLKYKNSLSLLSMMSLIMYGVFVDIIVAPSVTLLRDYGGHLTIQEYRKAHARIKFNSTVNYKKMKMIPTSRYITEHSLQGR